MEHQQRSIQLGWSKYPSQLKKQWLLRPVTGAGQAIALVLAGN
jgi:hypothetical protein